MAAEQRQAKIVVLGDTGVGKTSIIRRLVNDVFDKYSEPTIGAAFTTKQIPLADGTSIKFLIWDTAGQEKYHSLVPMYYRGAAAAVIVYDITRPESFDVLKHWHEELKTRGPEGIVIVVAGNKADCEESRRVDRLDAEAFASSIGAQFFETSAKSDQNITAVFQDIAQRLPVSEETTAATTESDVGNLSGGDGDGGKRRKRGCC